MTVRLRAEVAEEVERAAAMLRAGKLVAFATETVYGLGAQALSPEAVAGIFKAKGRPSWDPLIVHVASTDALEQVARIPAEIADRVQRLVHAFWPGPLTLLLPRTRSVPDAVTAGRALVGVRVPAHPAAQALLRAAGLPIAAPSANRFGHVSPTTAQHVLADLEGRIDAVLDAGPCSVGVESTVLDPAQTPMVVYRAGGVSLEQIRKVCPEADVVAFTEPQAETSPQALPSPGVGMRHYAPEVPLVLVEGSPEAVRSAVEAALDRQIRVGVLLPENWFGVSMQKDVEVRRWGRWESVETLASGLFAGLRSLERSGVQEIVCPLPPSGGLGDAVRDRLRKAARR